MVCRYLQQGVERDDEMSSRGGDRKIEACLLVETLRVPDAEKIAAALAHESHRTEIGVYQLLCEITADGLPRTLA